MKRRVYILFDSRAADGMGTDDSSVLVVCDSDDEAKSYRGDFGAMACYSYRKENNQLSDEQFEWNWFG